MKIGVIITEDSENWGGEVGFGNFFLSRLSEISKDDIQYELIYAVTGLLPQKENIPTFTGFIISGSHHSVNNDFQWIRKLEKFVRVVYDMPCPLRPKLVGTCFGHLLIAKALGGEVRRNECGKFNCGAVTVYTHPDLFQKSCYKDIFGDRTWFTIMQSHGEEVAVSPPDAMVLAESNTCLYEVLCYKDHIISIQGYFDIIEAKMKDIIMPELLRKDVLTEKEMEAAIKTFDDVDTDAIVRFALSFLTQ